MIVPVVAGILRQPDGRVLIAQRPAGKIAAGRWEFPGGKIEAGESRDAALRRELHEELGVELRSSRPLIRIVHAYTERTVELDCHLVTAWDGEPHGREDQALAWVQPSRIWDYDLLEADGPIVHALRLPSLLPVTGPFESPSALRDRCLALAEQGHRLIRLRAPQLNDAQYAASVASAAPALAAAGSGLLVDRPGLDLEQPGVAGLHLTARRLQAPPPRPSRGWLFASCHDAADVAAAAAWGADAILLGAVCATPSHPGQAALGWPGFAALARQANRPVYAIGGLTPADRDRAYAHGAQGVAAISAFWPGGDGQTPV